ncbi:hypothetical protein [Streptomyces sp. NPDC016845]|uniref:hypothetical protein n=1 Tax=Streptomyces sp. NPDC016845 TaxID=3364972 RepID=UPI0037B374CC
MTTVLDQMLLRARLRTDDFAYQYPQAAIGEADCTSRDSTQAFSTDVGNQLQRPNASTDARRDLRTLCETLIEHAGIEHLTDFLDHTLVLEPESARTLGCYLQIGGFHDGARFWWQFAAGAGDHTASFCLYLQHLSMGEAATAAWWQHQTPHATPTDTDLQVNRLTGMVPTSPADTSLPTTLRILRKLKLERPYVKRPATNDHEAVAYVTRAASFVDDDVELPLLDAEFTQHIRSLSAQAGPTHSPASAAAPSRARSRPLPSRPTPAGRSVVRLVTSRRAAADRA